MAGARVFARSPAALREESVKQAGDAKLKGETLRLGLRPATIRRHLGNLDHFLKHLRSSHFAVPEWTFEGLGPRKPLRGEVRLQQVKPRPSEIRLLFDILFFTGRLSAETPNCRARLSAILQTTTCPCSTPTSARGGTSSPA
jgi:hypothetical protein